MDSTEFGLLLKSHDESNAKKLLDERYSSHGSQKPFLVLHEGKNDKLVSTTQSSTSKRKKSSKRPNSHQIRKSVAAQQSQRFRKSANPDFHTYEPLNELWNQYITTTLGKASGVAAAQSILSSDWNGAKMRVTSCRNPSALAIRGILIYETRSQWLVATADSGIKLLPKSGTIIRSEHPSQDFEIVGDRVIYRPSERTTRKFKPHEVTDIAALFAL